MTAEEPPKKSRWAAIFNLAMFILGGSALVWMLRTTSWGDLEVTLVRVGNWAGIILGLDLISLCLDAAAWRAFMRPEARMVSYPRVLGAWASGRAINVLTPFGALGEPTKITMLMEKAPKARLMSSLVLFNATVLYFSVTVMLIGIPITLLTLDLSHAIKVACGIGVAVIVPLMVMLGLVIHRGAVATLVGTLRKLHVIGDERAKDWKSRLGEVDKHIRELHNHRTAGTSAGILFIATSKLVTYTSTMLLIHAVGVHLSFSLIVAVLSVGVLIQWVSSIVPLGLGLADGGNAALYVLLGATSQQGLFVTMLNRVRSVAVAMFGLGLMAIMAGMSRLQKKRIQDKIVELKERQELSRAVARPTD
ncbi:MAG TPA: lysylphosphatidylglycerol synthase transmembrane domain-containing protein [Kofleriaceae bacterium]|jgi:uncharacterized protein (TIRG00374 family)